MSDSLWLHGLQHSRLPYPSPITGACSNSCPSTQFCHLTISSSVIPFSSCLQSFPASGSFPMSQFFTLGGQTIGVSASVLMKLRWWDIRSFPFLLSEIFILHCSEFVQSFQSYHNCFLLGNSRYKKARNYQIKDNIWNYRDLQRTFGKK